MLPHTFKRFTLEQSSTISILFLQRNSEQTPTPNSSTDTLTCLSHLLRLLSLAPPRLGALIRYHTKESYVSNDVRWMVVTWQQSHLKQTVPHLFFWLLYDLAEKLLCSQWNTTNVRAVTIAFSTSTIFSTFF